MIRPRTVLPVLLLAVCSATLPATRARAQPVSCTQDTDCDDGNPCTEDKCLVTTVISLCGHGSIGGCVPCLIDADCDDGAPCTADVCDGGRCSAIPDSGPVCDDGDACTTGDVCQDGACLGTPLPCSDGITCTEDTCEAGACVHRPDDSACGDGDECAAATCRPDDPAANASGCAVDPAPFEDSECTPDDDACTVDRCQAATCTHAVVSDVAQCSPVRPSYMRAVELQAGVDRLLNFVSLEAPLTGQSGDLVMAQLTGMHDDLTASARALGGLGTADSLPPGTRLRLRANPSIAQLRGALALAWLRGTPSRARKFLGAVSRGRRRREIDPETARELRRNGRILLAGSKALKRDVKSLQKTFSIFQR